MASTFVLIDKVILTSSQASVEFTSIPNTFTDLKILMSVRDSGASVERNIRMTFNSVGGTAYSSRILYGYGTGVASYTNNSSSYMNYFYAVAANATANTFSNNEIYIPNYASSNYKSFSVDSVAENNSSSPSMGLSSGLFSNTSAISSIKFDQDNPGDNFVSGSGFYLYGIKNS